jgi:hypothetical protein
MYLCRGIRNLERTMERDPIALATKLLVKAQGTTFDAEAAALTGRAYRLLADALNAYEDEAAPAGSVRKRERRQLRDRRSTPGSPAASVPRRTTGTTAAHRRPTDWVGLPAQGRVDLRI